ETDVLILVLEVSVVIKDLNAVVVPVTDVHVALRVCRDRVREVELAMLGAPGPPGLYEFAILVELRDPRVAVSIGDENVPGGTPGHVGRAIKVVPQSARSNAPAPEWRCCGSRPLGCGPRLRRRDDSGLRFSSKRHHN